MEALVDGVCTEVDTYIAQQGARLATLHRFRLLALDGDVAIGCLLVDEAAHTRLRLG